MDTNQPLTYQQIIDRISSDKALHELLQQLLDELQQLRAEISEFREVLGGGTASKYLTIPEVAKLFGVCSETVRRRARKGEWPALVIGRQTRFGCEEIAKIRELSRRPTHNPPDSAARRARNKQLRSLSVFTEG